MTGALVRAGPCARAPTISQFCACVCIAHRACCALTSLARSTLEARLTRTLAGQVVARARQRARLQSVSIVGAAHRFLDPRGCRRTQSCTERANYCVRGRAPPTHASLVQDEPAGALQLHSRCEQSAPPKPASHVHFPSTLHDPRWLHMFGHCAVATAASSSSSTTEAVDRSMACSFAAGEE